MTHIIVGEEKIICAWDDCPLPGHAEIRGKGPSSTPGVPLNYLFCSERHKSFWLFSPHGNGLLPRGYRQMWAHGAGLQVIVR